MALVVFLQEDEDVPSVYRNLKIFCETAPYLDQKRSNILIRMTFNLFQQIFVCINGKMIVKDM